MAPTDKETLVATSLALAAQVQTNDANGVKAHTIPEYAKDFGGIADTIATAAPHLQGASFQPESVWILDARDNKTPQDTQFFCSLSKSTSSVTFSLQALPGGRYGLAILDTVHAAAPWQVALLTKETAPGTWQLAGLFPRATSASGHDGLWYWTQARNAAAKKQLWNAWLLYGEAEQLLKPVEFISTTHLDQLHEEQTRSAPAALSAGIGASTPLFVKAKDGTEYLFTALGPDDSLSNDRIDLAVHYKADPIADPAAARLRNQKAASALVDAYPELREAFHGVWVYADSPNRPPFASEEPIVKLQ